MDLSFVDSLYETIKNVPMDFGFEGVVVMDSNANILFEHRWIDDYHRDIYSNTKSFTSAAVGMAIHDGLLDLTSKPIDYFEFCRKEVDVFWNELTLEDLLTMRSGFDGPLLMYFDRRAGIGAEDYVSYLMSQPIVRRPGSRYLYSTADAILAGCMVEKACGMPLQTYLFKKFFF